jgi:predicted ribosome quality control (RQC) complex YloA/Tae2 family protein
MFFICLSEIYYHLYIEFFANGNIILTDNQNKIIISQRYFKYDDNNIVFKEHIYQTNFENIPNNCIDNTINLKEEFKILGTECINTIFVENIELNNNDILNKIEEIKNSPKFTIYSKKSINELFLSFHSNFYDNLYENNLYDNKTIYTNIFDCLK